LARWDFNFTRWIPSSDSKSIVDISASPEIVPMRSITVLEAPTGPDKVCRGHEGRYWELVKLGDDVWSYYLMTRKQLRFWRRLTGRERKLFTGRETDECFLCALDAAEMKMEKFEEGLYSALMRSLLLRG
jgi:hypothetical protein